MPLIKSNKQYDFLVTFGCSFTGGHQLREQGAWGHFFAQRLGCKHVNRAGGASNTNIVTSVINFCEHNDMSNACIGIQWSEATRRELWEEYNNAYYTIGLGGLSDDFLWSRENQKEFLGTVRNNLGWFSTVWFDIRENVLRTILAMIQVKSYLEYKNIDFIQFEGINSILDSDRMIEEVRYDGSSHPSELALLNLGIKQSILQDDTFFSELGDLNKVMREHPSFDHTLNDGHPHPEILNFWTDKLFAHIQKVESKNN